jgi:hypothetical protein
MKFLILLATLFSFGLLAQTQEFMKEGAGGHGGDPFDVEAEPFPNTELLSNGLRLTEQRVSQANLPEGLKTDFLSELATLETNKKFLYIENIIILADEIDGYRVPTDAKKFLGLGAMTSSKKGSSIYFSKKTAAYDVETFSTLLIHEILHHVVTEGLSNDEVFVDRISKEIAAGGISEEMRKALKMHAWFRPDYVSGSQFAYAFVNFF